MVEPVRIELNEEEVQAKSDSEKLTDLVKIAFANHEQLSKQGLILFGNGEPKNGLCFKVATQGTRLNWLIAILSTISGIILTAIVSYSVK